MLQLLYITNNISDLEENLPTNQRDKIRSAPDVTCFYNHLVHEPMNIFLQTNKFLNLWTLISLATRFKKLPIVTVMSLDLSNIFYCFWLPGLFECFTACDRRYMRQKHNNYRSLNLQGLHQFNYFLMCWYLNFMISVAHFHLTTFQEIYWIHWGFNVVPYVLDVIELLLQ